MENMELVEKLIVYQEKATERRRLFLSNLDLVLVSYHESVAFFNPPENGVTFSNIRDSFLHALRSVLVPYDFLAGRLIINEEGKYEIDCNNNGAVVVLAKTASPLRDLGNLQAPNDEFSKLISFLHEEDGEQKDIKTLPLLLFQLTQFGCGSIALASKYNHCAFDGMAVREFEQNLAALTRGSLIKIPKSDRSIFKARNPPIISFPHLEYTKEPYNIPKVDVKDYIYEVSFKQVASFKGMIMKEGTLRYCSTFQALAAKIWRARIMASKVDDETIVTMLFPVNVRDLVVPKAPDNFVGNALVPGFAQAKAKEIKETTLGSIVRMIQEGVERMNDEYVKSSIDWLEVNKGMVRLENSFSLVSWFKLGLDDEHFSWGKCVAASPITSSPVLVFLLPGKQGGLTISVQLSDDQAPQFSKSLYEV